MPDEFAAALDGREPQELKLREAGGGRLWAVDVVFDGDGHMYLTRGWAQFARAHGLGLGSFLVFTYDGGSTLSVSVFGVTTCRKRFQRKKEDTDQEDDAGFGFDSPPLSSSPSGSGSRSKSSGGAGYEEGGSEMDGAEDDDDVSKSRFSVMLRQCHFGLRQKQYLNVPVEFQVAQGYAGRSKVELRMRGKAWSVKLKQGVCPKRQPRTSLRYGWHQFCVDNRLAVGDTCFFRVLHPDQEEDEDDGDGDGEERHVLKVEVRRRDGSFVK